MGEQVTEGGKADRVGLKLGDSIVQINDQDTTDMALQEAQQIIDISDKQLKLKVQKLVSSSPHIKIRI